MGSKGIFFIDRSSAQPSIDFFEFASARVTKRIPLSREPEFWVVFHSLPAKPGWHTLRLIKVPVT